MAEMFSSVSSAVVQETVSEIFSSLKEKYCKGRSNNPKKHMERLEMAHIRLEAAVQMSQGWNITSAPLLRWRSKLKHAMQDCDDTLRKCKKRIREDDEEAEVVMGGHKISHYTRQFVSSIFNRHGSSELISRSIVKRFEWFADGASDFMRFIELGCTPRQYMFLGPLVRNLLTGKTIEYKLVLRHQQHLFYLRPVNTPEGMEGRLLYVLKDSDAPENSFLLALSLRISESTDIVGVAVRCIELLAPHFKSTAETVKRNLTQLPMHDFCWVPYADSIHKQHWNKVHDIFSKWFRPNTCCCKQEHGHHQYRQPDIRRSSTESSSHHDTYLEPVIKVYLEGNIPMSSAGHNHRRKGFPYMKLRLLFAPHTSSEDMLRSSSSVDGSAVEMVRGQEQHGLYANISFKQLDEIILPKAIDCFRQKAGATEYQLLWRSKHGAAYIQVEEAASRRSQLKNRKGHRQQWQDNKVEGWTHAVTDFLGSWIAYAPDHLQGSIEDWINVETELALTRL
ncbi:hypothetical protein BDA96_02G104700 [Sorghum bicolor]|uniref:Uncharacterized protein n=1 Tax=Sorghum bicolor TaxID=4558 RepID=A0A921RL57_SORBI|nr:hypothetical protein BDA96_02G104700 [Sorghum bicolor]